MNLKANHELFKVQTLYVVSLLDFVSEPLAALGFKEKLGALREW